MNKPIKHTLAVLLLALSLLAGCARQPPAASAGTSSLAGAPAPQLDLKEWEAVRRELPKSCRLPDLLPTPAMTDRPLAQETVEALSGALALWPQIGRDFGPDQPIDTDVLLTLACFAADGVEVGSPNSGGRLGALVDEQLGRPGSFLTKEQVEWAAGHYFGNQLPLEHGDAPSWEETPFHYCYDQRLGVYRYPDQPVDWKLPYLLDISYDGEQVECYFVFIGYSARGESTGFSTWEQKEIPRWELDAHMLESYSRYDEYRATLDFSGDRPIITSVSLSRKAALPRQESPET